MPPTEPAAPPDLTVRSWRLRGLIALTALAIPLAWTTFDIVNRGALFPYLLRRNRLTYLESALLGLAFWSLGMEAARHASRGVRVVALALVIQRHFRPGADEEARLQTRPMPILHIYIHTLKYLYMFKYILHYTCVCG